MRERTQAMWMLSLSLAVFGLLRVPFLAITPSAHFIARAMAALSLARALEKNGMGVALLFCTLLPLAAWLLDLIEGAETFVLGAAGLAMALVLLKARWNPLLTAVLAALACAVVTALGLTGLQMFQQGKTLGYALGNALTRQILPALSYLLGNWVILQRKRPSER